MSSVLVVPGRERVTPVAVAVADLAVVTRNDDLRLLVLRDRARRVDGLPLRGVP